jgi:hypothetical protein
MNRERIIPEVSSQDTYNGLLELKLNVFGTKVKSIMSN